MPAGQIVPADLSDWSYRPLAGQVAVDPHLGRIAFPPLHTRRQAVWVSYSYGFPADMGGGEYARTQSQPQGAAVYLVGSKPGQFSTIDAALAFWSTNPPKDAVIEPATAISTNRKRSKTLGISSDHYRAPEHGGDEGQSKKVPVFGPYARDTSIGL